MSNNPDPYIHYTGSLVNGNYVWTGAMNLCWTELCERIIMAPIALRTRDEMAISTTDHLNHPVMTRDDLLPDAYYVKAGFGMRTLEEINRESRKKFPLKSFNDIEADLGDDDIISYAYFYKKVEYEKPFSLKKVRFDTSLVQGFAAKEDEMKTIEVLDYVSADKFIIRLRLKNQEDELILAKGYPTDHPSVVLQAFNSVKHEIPAKPGAGDQFQMPSLDLNIRRDYTEMIGQHLDNEGFQDRQIGLMFENIAFAMDEKGARVESQAVITVERSAYRPQQKTRYFYLDKPFWVIMKQRKAERPYFLLGVNQTNIMQTN